MKKSMAMAALCMAAALTVGSIMPVHAAKITEDAGATSTQQVEIVKESEKPIFSVEIPSQVSVSSGDAQRIAYSITEEDLNNIPEGKKVAITIADAGYGETTGKFALWNEEAGAEATYGLYGSVFSTRPSEAYGIGGGYVSFYGNEKAVDGKFTMNRAIQVNNFDTLADGTYRGYITYNIALVNQ